MNSRKPMRASLLRNAKELAAPVMVAERRQSAWPDDYEQRKAGPVRDPPNPRPLGIACQCTQRNTAKSRPSSVPLSISIAFISTR